MDFLNYDEDGYPHETWVDGYGKPTSSPEYGFEDMTGTCESPARAHIREAEQWYREWFGSETR